MYYREKGNAHPITYELTIDIDESGRPYVKEEQLRQRVQKTGWPLSFLHLQNGKGDAFEGTEGWQDEEGRILTGWYMRYMEGACQYVISWWFDRIKKEKVSKSKCEWADKIGEKLDLDTNNSPSFQAFLYELEKRIVMV